MDPGIRDREMRLWLTLGPAIYRLRSVGLAALLALAGVVVVLGVMTAINHFPGSGSVYQGPGDHPVRVVVGDCQRTGPVSRRGFGYWWECDAVVTAADGAVREARIGRSVVTPEDRGRSVDLREGCRDKEASTDCAYGSPTSEWLEVGVLLVGKLGWVVAVIQRIGRPDVPDPCTPRRAPVLPLPRQRACEQMMPFVWAVSPDGARWRPAAAPGGRRRRPSRARARPRRTPHPGCPPPTRRSGGHRC